MSEKRELAKQKANFQLAINGRFVFQAQGDIIYAYIKPDNDYKWRTVKWEFVEE